jgi:hypothetical protein
MLTKDTRISRSRIKAWHWSHTAGQLSNALPQAHAHAHGRQPTGSKPHSRLRHESCDAAGGQYLSVVYLWNLVGCPRWHAAVPDWLH